MTTPLLAFDSVSVAFATGGRLSRILPGRRDPITAVDDVSLSIDAGSALGIVGESGSGKSTLMRTALGLQSPTAGRVTFRGEPLPTRRTLAQRRSIQMVFQDPGTTLNPAHTIGDTLSEAIRTHRMVPRADTGARVRELMDLVHLPERLLGSHPRALSGGQKQRVAIARALAVEPEVLVADEATSALDVIVQAAILDLLVALRRETGVTLVCVSHDLEVIRYVCDDVAVLRYGKVVEQGAVGAVLESPEHPYTRELIQAAPVLAPSGGHE